MKVFRRVLFWAHLIVGVSTGVVVFVMSATGVALTYQRQVQQWADGFEALPAEAASEPLPLPELLRLAREERQEEPTALLLRNDPAQPVRVSFGRQSVETNPYTGEPLGAGAVGVRRMFRALIGWHRWLGQEGEGRAAARAITGFSNLAFLFIVISGLWLWWPRSWSWRNFRAIVFFRRRLSTKARHFNWHNVFGFWTAVPLAILVMTGAFFSYSWPTGLLYWSTGEERPVRGGRSGAAPEAPPSPDDFEGMGTLVATALRQDPAWRLATVRFGEGPVTVTLDRSRMGTRPDLRRTLVMDRETGAVLGEETPTRAQTARVWIRWLHTGEAFGFIGQTLAGIASLAGCFLVYTGWSLSWRRFLAWRRRRVAEPRSRPWGASPLPPPAGADPSLPGQVTVLRSERRAPPATTRPRR